MSKLVLREIGHQQRRGAKPLGLEIDKTPDHEVATIVNSETGETLFSMSVDQTRKVVLGVNTSAKLEVLDSVSKAPVVQRVASKDKDPANLRNWKIENGVFTTWLANGNSISLDIADQPGPYTPDSALVHEVLGQPEMVFAVAYAVKNRKHFLLEGPTGTAKTTVLEWFASVMNWNFIRMPIARGTEAANLVGEYLPVDEAGKFEWTDGPVTQAVRLSQSHPTLLAFDELNRIGNLAEFARVYSLLDDGRFLELKEKRSNGVQEMLKAGDLYIGATSNPSDDDAADYVGVQDLDPALMSRFSYKPKIGYPLPDVEARALMDRVPGLKKAEADAMVSAATRIRVSENVRFPISFRELEAWALALPYYGWKQAAEISFVTKAAPMYQPDLRNLLKLQANTAPVAPPVTP